MTATDELRKLLDERGVEHEDDEDVTRFFGPDGFEVVMQEDIDGKLDCLTPIYLTPEQAVEATLGRGELERENAKLRELCGFVLMFTTMTDGCGDTCPYSCNNCQSECYFRKRARELGVEVDG